MKKIIIVILMSVFLIVPFNVRAFGNVPIYQLDTKISELNNYTLREIFENRNMASPDLTDKEHLGYGVYRLYDDNGVSLDYNVYNGFWLFNGTVTSQFVISFTDYITIGLLTAQMLEISGTSSVSFTGWSFGSSSLAAGRIYFNHSTNKVKTKTFDKITLFSNLRFDITNGTIFDNYRFKLQLEQGTTATPYQIPTNGPYNDIDVSQFGLTQQQLEYYFNLYQLAVKYELDNRSAVKDEGNYKTIFQSIYDGLLNLMRSMGTFWQFINRPILMPEFTSLNNAFQIDWSWNILDVVRQIVVNLGSVILMGSFQSINLVFSAFGLPIRVSILSLVFSNLIFVLLGWIIIKSFII